MKAIAIHQTGMRLMTGLFSALWIAAALLAAASAHADIYFWEDRDGVIHFSNQDAPPEASLYMREIAPPVPPDTSEIQPEIDTEALAKELARKQALTQQRLEEANRKLDDALDRVDDLTESVSRSKAQAVAAAEAARQAELEARAARDYQTDDKKRVIVHAVPYRPYKSYRRHNKEYRYNHRKHKFNNRHARHLHHDKKFSLTHNRGKSRIDKFRAHRKNHYRYQIPGPILPPAENRIPKAYGIR